MLTVLLCVLGVRCNKEKPTCSRCETRGLDCQYLQSKRPGRVPGSGARRLQLNQSADGSVAGDTTSSQESVTNMVINDNIGQTNFPSPLSSGNVADCPTTNDHFRVDSIFSASDGLSEPGFFTSALDMSTGTNASFDANNMVSHAESLDMLSAMDDVTFTDFAAYDTDLGGLGGLGDLNSWWPFDDKTTGLTELSIIDSQLPQSTSNSASTDKSVEPSPQTSSSLSSGVNLRGLTTSGLTSTFISDDAKRSPPNFPNTAQLVGQAPVAAGSCQCTIQVLDLLKSLLTTPRPR